MIHFVNPWGLLALLAIPLILFIHLYRQKFPQKQVAGLFLWTSARREVPAGRIRDRLPFSWSLVLELLVALFIALLLAQPRFSAGDVPHLVLILDDSASMIARARTGETIRDRVLQEIENRVAKSGSNTLLTVLTTGKRPAVLIGPTLPWQEAQSQLSRWRPTATAHDPSPTWDLALQLAKDNAPILFFTDGPVPEPVQPPAELEVIALGEPLPNLAIASARWQIDPNRSTGRILGHLSNFSEEPARITLIGSSRGVQHFTQTLTIPAGETESFQTEIPLEIGNLLLEVRATNDYLLVDSRLDLVEPQPQNVPVANALPPDHPAHGPIERLLDALPEVTRSEPATAALVITNHLSAPRPHPSVWQLVFPEPSASSTSTESQQSPPEPPRIVTDPQSPLLAGVTFQGLRAQDVSRDESNANADGTPLATLNNLPLLSRNSTSHPPAFFLHINFNQSQFTTSPDWPILFSNLVNLVRDDLPGLHRWNYRLGEGITLRPPIAAHPNASPLRLTGPHTSRQVTRFDILSIAPPAHPGLYRLQEADNTLAQFAINFFDPSESDLRSRDSFLQQPVPQETRGAPIDSLESWPVLLALFAVMLLLLLNWYLLTPVKIPRQA